jgi:transcriptional regulator with XRE-family HTH domain
MKRSNLLKLARIDAGFTQEELADALGVSVISIYRWEHGDSSPNAYFRQRLRKLYHLSEQELGLQETQEGEPWSRDSSSCLIDPGLPVHQTIPLGQQSLLKEISGSHRSMIGLTGLPGSGKTAIAQAIAGLPDLRKHVEGMFWATVGQESSPLRHLQRWLSLLGDEGMVPERIEDIQDRLRVLLRGRKMLIVLDDLWKTEDILPYQLGPSCRYVLTTRLPVVAYTVCDQVFHPRPLTDPQAFHLLSHSIPMTLVREHSSVLRALCQQIGLLPLALEHMGKYLYCEARTSSNRRFQEALAALFQPTAYLHLPPDRSLATSIQRSEAWLSPASRHAFFTLASLLPNAPATFAEQQVVDLIQQAQPLQMHDFDQLVDVGLVNVAGPNRYQIHPVIAAYARQLVEKRPDTAV